MADGGQHDGVVARALAHRQAQGSGNAKRRHTTGPNGRDDVADQIHDDGRHGHMAAGDQQKLFGRQLQGAVVGGDGTQQRHAQQHNECTGAEAFDDVRVPSADDRAENPCRQDRDQAHILFHHKSDRDDSDQDHQRDQCNTVAHKNASFFLVPPHLALRGGDAGTDCYDRAFCLCYLATHVPKQSFPFKIIFYFIVLPEQKLIKLF